jgi:hypothetical protein
MSDRGESKTARIALNVQFCLHSLREQGCNALEVLAVVDGMFMTVATALLDVAAPGAARETARRELLAILERMTANLSQEAHDGGAGDTGGSARRSPPEAAARKCPRRSTRSAVSECGRIGGWWHRRLRAADRRLLIPDVTRNARTQGTSALQAFYLFAAQPGQEHWSCPCSRDAREDMEIKLGDR